MPPEYFFDKDPLGFNGYKHTILLMCDFDGTLAPIQGDPGKCILLPDIGKQLEIIAHTDNSRVAILSGRPLADIQRKAPIKDIFHAGSHGLEISGPQTRYIHPGAVAVKPIIDKVRNSFEEKIGNVKGILIEKKKLSFTLHYRMANKTNWEFVRKTFYKTISENTERERMAVLKGKKVLELLPNVPWDKGRAALLIIKQLKKKCLPVYIGDDVTDECAFKALFECGITIRVGQSKKTAAQYYLKNQKEISRFLEYINRAACHYVLGEFV